jgi:cobalt-zinc-cadmium efflux system outer membrane protein
MGLGYMRGVSVLGCFLLLTAGAGCAQKRPFSQAEIQPEKGIAKTEPEAALTRGAPAEAGMDTDLAADPTGVLTLRQALALALMKNPALASTSWDIRTAEARRLQAGLLPNPEAGVDIEEFGGGADRSGFDVATTTFQLSQLIELGGKRGKRSRAAAIEKDLAGWDYQARRLDVLAETTKAFIEVLAAQEQRALGAELVRLSEQVLYSVSERVKAGKVSPLDETKAGVELANTRIEYERTKSSLRGARKRLSSIWGQAEPTFEKVDGVLDAVRAIPSQEQLTNLVSRNPDVARWVKEMEQRTAALDVEKAKRIPDLTVRGGFQRFNEINDQALVFGVSLPLPLFDRNQGGIKEARHKLAKAGEESRAAIAKANMDLAGAYQELSASYEGAVSLKTEVLPAAEFSFNASSEGYREGKFDFLEFLDAQRTLFQARGKYIETLAAYHKAAADIERLTGEKLEAAMETPSK